MNNYTVAAAVALALGTATAAQAQNAACANPDYQLYVAGSSAAKPAFQTALAADLFSGETSYSSSNGDFEAFCGPVSTAGANATGLTAGSTAIVYYRAEGGSVVGALPVVSGQPVKFLDLTGPGCNSSTTPTTTGSSASNGTTDSWGGCVTQHGVELGVTDLEPSVFIQTSGAKNYPTAYSTAVFGSASQAQLVTLAGTSVPLFQQVFGIFVNQSGLTTGGATLNLSKETVAQILTGHYTDWSKVPTASGGQVSTTSATIVIKNREAGSGTRTGATLYFLGQECTPTPIPLKDGAASNDYYATSDVLKAAASTPGSITYASIDNQTKQSNLTMAQLSGVTPTNLAAASGQYDWWFEATAIPGNTSGTSGGITSPGGQSLETFLVGGELQKLSSAPHALDINVIPGQAGNTASVPLASSAGAQTIYVNPFTRSGNSCNLPLEQN